MSVVTQPSGGDNTIVEVPSTTSAPPSELSRGSTIGRYVVLDRVGAGGMGVVYAAYDPELDRKVAIKVLHRVGQSESAQNIARARLLREAQALAKLPHPNVVAIHDVGTFAERAWIAMEFVAGKTLSAWLRAEPRPWSAVLDVLLAAGDGLAAAHAADLLHRDLKPDNIMIDETGRVRVMDFGLARGRELDASERSSTTTNPALVSSGTMLALDVTSAGSLIGTPAYMSPEQLGATGATPASDQFAFCVTCWEALFGERPFAGDTVHGQLAAMLDGPPTRGPKPVPAWLRRVLERGLAIDSTARHRDMPTLLAAMRGGRQHARRRGYVLLVLGALGIGALAWGIREAVERSAIDACERESEEIATRWPGRAAEIDAAIRNTGLAYADASADGLPKWLDRFAERWTRAAAATCLAATVDGSLDTTMRLRAQACLDAHAGTLTGLLDALGEGTPGAAQAAIAAGAGLPDPSECADPRVLATQPWSAQIDPTRVAALRTGFARADALEYGGRIPDALALDDALLADAIALGWEPLIAEARARRGGRLAELSRLPEADETLRQAYFEALRAGADATAARAAMRLVKTIGYAMGRHDDGLVWSEHALAVLDRLGNASALDRAALDEMTSLVHRERGAFDEAQRLQENVIAVRIEAVGEDHPSVASSLESLGNTLRLLGENDAAAAAHRRALTIRETVLGPTHPTVAASLNNLANAVDDVECEVLLLRALEIGEAAYGRDSFEVVPGLANLGSAYLRTGRREEARALYIRALAIEERVLGPDHHEVAGSHANLGSALLEMGRVDEALEHIERALAISKRRLRPDHPNIAQMTYGLGLVHAARGEDEQAIEAFRLAKPIFGRGDAEQSFSNGLRLAGSLRRLGRFAEAEREVAAVRAAVDASNPETEWALALADLEDAKIIAARGRHDEAITRFTAALAEEEPDSVAAASLRFEIAMSRIAQRGRTEALVADARAAHDDLVNRRAQFLEVRDAGRRLEALGIARSRDP